LKALPSALPPLVVDGIFAPITLQHVKEFQTSTFEVWTATGQELVDHDPDHNIL
jgi:hypothetical protein